MTSEIVKAVCLKLVEFRVMDNSEKSAKNFAEDMLSNMDLFWDGKLVDGLLGYLKHPKFLREPRQCVKSLRVLLEMTTHCTEENSRRLALGTNILHFLKDILETPKIRELIVRTSLDLISNLVLSGWQARAAVESDVLVALLKLMNPHRKDPQKFNALLAQILWFLYKMLGYKVPFPNKIALVAIAVALEKHLLPNRDVNIILLLLRLARLVSEYNSVTLPAMIYSGLFERVAPFVLSPVTEIKREAIFILANTCEQPRKRRKDLLYRFPKIIILYINDFFLSGTVEFRVLMHQLLGVIIENKCIRTDMMLRLIPKIIWCASKREPELEVRRAAGWTLASLAIHLEPKNFSLFIKFGGYHVLCQVLISDPPAKLLQNILAVFLKLIRSHPDMKPFLLSVLRHCGVWPILQKLLDSENPAVNTLATLLCLYGETNIYCVGWMVN
ncbi:uncharacterized protein LOC119547554 [Drosophila subpulchrella]|uniref:uncharacterized protein LOC119547554 n=1 Tax=Drosophila subpulchrella TaxID=1486046 RepID=UPI0018A1A927|nr:uncharacterized protein LOC119547554 [Drosophila subpulchrella]